LFDKTGDDVWRYVGKLSDAQRSMLDDRFKWKVCFYNQTYDNILQKGTAIALRLRMYCILPDGMLGKGNG
jgi:hypothetical protein